MKLVHTPQDNIEDKDELLAFNCDVEGDDWAMCVRNYPEHLHLGRITIDGKVAMHRVRRKGSGIGYQG